MTNPAPVPARIDAIEDRGSGVYVVTLAPQRPFAWHAGQYAHLSAAGLPVRAFSIANAGQDGPVFHIRDTGQGMSAWLAKARPGDTLTLQGPYGNLSAEPARARPVIMVAGGTGAAPLLALAFDIVKRGLSEDDITFIYGARSEDDVYCRRELDVLRATGAVSLHLAIGPETPDQVIRRLGLNLAHHIAYISGPDPMMLSVRAALADHLADPERIFTDIDWDDLQKTLT